jgi:lactate dehydrogenase-like 2-hydroxyacid dehydrogenase
MAASTLPNQGAYQLAILDDYFDLAPEYFSSLPVTARSYHETLDASTPEGLSALQKRLQPYTIISSMRERTRFPAALLSALPNLRLLLTTGPRNAAIDMAAAAAHGIVVAGTTGAASAVGSAEVGPPASLDSTTQHCLALLLSLSSRIPLDHARLTDASRQGQTWESGLAVPLPGKTIGMVGLGRLGSNFARLCAGALGMRVIAWSPNLTQERAEEVAKAQGLPAGSVKMVSKKELFAEADFVSLQLVLSERTVGVVGREELGWMKETAFLINSARGPLMDEEALFEVLEKGKIRGAALDVFWKEPLPADSRWRTTRWGEDGRSMVVLSPHMGYVNEVTMKIWYQEQAADIKRWLAGENVALKIN